LALAWYEPHRKRITLLTLAMYLLVLVVSSAILFVGRTIALDWTSAFGIGFTVDGIQMVFAVRAGLGRRR